MIKILMGIVGLLIICSGLVAAWKGLEKVEDLRKKGQSVNVEKAQNTHNGKSAEEGDKVIAAIEKDIAGIKTERNLWFGLTAFALVGGCGIALASMSRKRNGPVLGKASAQPQDVPEPIVP